ncbi:MAG TPA: hypothetical protein VD862_04620 [Candidatus Paceibacterota bacterium]|nr:hypothetical protein [Candidatus Paceibacterota bacterium]
MKTLSLFVILALTVVGIAGPFAMSENLAHGTDCFLSSISALPCLSIGSAAQHLSSLQRVLASVPVLSALTLLLAAFGAVLIWRVSPVRADGGLWHTSLVRTLPFEASLSRFPVFRWNIRLNHSPTGV